MKKIIFVTILSFISLSTFAYDSALDLYSGEKVKINVLGCKQNEVGEISLDQKSGVVSVSCSRATCQAVESQGVYKVYRYKGEECTWKGCNRGTPVVGSFVSKKSILSAPLKKDMEAFIKTSKDCGSLKSFVSGYHGFIEVVK